ncbi:hypothetical protein Bca52824_012849 [Brassica carinata]|uniref:Uncharacterized protein n=1 Tax=Brassica carinata TaxID=52824 RepID=A0A8X7VXU2_BRACI|nr:hypothetical protein Bca52824_012849 [Brassica carinata]
MKQPSQLGAWAKPLHFTPPATPPDPSTPRVEFAHLVLTNRVGLLKEGLQEKPKRKQLLVGRRYLQPTFYHHLY